MRAPAPEGWSEIFGGSCLRASLVQAVLDASGLRSELQSFSPDFWAGNVMEDCRVYVPTEEAEIARQVLSEAEPEDERGG